jgi:hypothetical protein
VSPSERVGPVSLDSPTSIVVRYSPVSMTAQKYDEAVQRVNQELGLSESNPPDSRDYQRLLRRGR